MQELTDIPGKWRQVSAAIIMNLGPFLIGMSCGCIASMSYDLQKENNELGTKPLTDENVSWLVSIGSVGVLIAMLFGPSLCESLGRKKTAIIEACIFITTCVVKLFTRNISILLVAQLVDGIGDGLTSLAIPLYITEMASDAIRGRLGTYFLFSVISGHCVAFIIGAVSPYNAVVGCILIVAIIHLGGSLLLPETPVYLVRKNRTAIARRSLVWFRGNDRIIAESELYKLQQFHRKIAQARSSFIIKDLFTDWANLKGLLISLVLLLVAHFSGIFIMIMYIVTILDKAKIPVESRIAGIIFLSISAFGCWLSTLTIDRFGRRPLLLLATSSMAISQIILGVFFTLNNLGYDVDKYGWIPIIAIIFYGFNYANGIGPVMTVLSNEIYNPELAGICNSIWWASFNILVLVLTKIYPSLTQAIGFHNCFFLFGAACICGFFFVLFIIPETKRKSIESIREGLISLNTKTYNITEETLRSCHYDE